MNQEYLPIEQEFEFRLSLLRLMAVPHDVPAQEIDRESRQMEEFAVMVRKARE